MLQIGIDERPATPRFSVIPIINLEERRDMNDDVIIRNADGNLENILNALDYGALPVPEFERITDSTRSFPTGGVVGFVSMNRRRHWVVRFMSITKAVGGCQENILLILRIVRRCVIKLAV